MITNVDNFFDVTCFAQLFPCIFIYHIVVIASRAKYKAMNTLQKIKGSSSYPYTQTEGVMGDALIKHAKNLGEDDVYGTPIFRPLYFYYSLFISYALSEFTILSYSLLGRPSRE